MQMKTEDQAYEEARQAQLDAGREIHIGSQVFLMNDRRRPMGRLIRPHRAPQFAKGVDVQRFATFDPNPHIPFVTVSEPMFRSNAEALAYVAVYVLAFVVVVLS